MGCFETPLGAGPAHGQKVQQMVLSKKKASSMPAPFADVQTVGLPRALLYYRYGALWKAFFEALGRTVVVDAASDRGVYEAGQFYSVDEVCLASKIYMGHVDALLKRDPAPDAIFIPCLANTGINHRFCTKFHALPDMVSNTFYERRPRILSFAVDVQDHGLEEEAGYLELAASLGASPKAAKAAWKAARRAQKSHDDQLARAQERLLQANKKLAQGERPLTILVAAHPYVGHDPYVGGPAVDALHEMGATVIFADECDHERAYKKSFEFSETMPWQVNRELVGAILLLHEQVDGIVIMSAFPCGPDSMTNDAITRFIKGKPLLTLTIDAQSGTAGMETRIESFVDILRYQKKGGYFHG